MDSRLLTWLMTGGCLFTVAMRLVEVWIRHDMKRQEQRAREQGTHLRVVA